MSSMRGGAPGRTTVVAAVLLAAAGSARGASLALDAPDTCVDPLTLEQEVTDLTGRPLNSVPDVDFRLTIRPAGARWRSTLEAREHRAGAPEVRHVRELEAKSCADLAEAAAVAMSVSIRAVAGSAPPPDAGPPARAPTPPSEILARPAPAPAGPVWGGTAAASLGADAGELPGVGLALGLTIGVTRGAARLNAIAGWLPPRDSVRPDGSGGTFQLAFGGAEVCFAPRRAGWTALACAGGELGVQHGAGLGVTVPESGSAFWRAARASLGAVVRASDALGFLVQVTGVVPLAPPQFVLDHASVVYKSAAVGVRLAAGVEMTF
jgi:hypothetical protein